MSKKGITPVIATVLLIGISIAAIGTAATFLTDLIGDVKKGVKDKLSAREKREASEITIIYGYESNNGNIAIDVTNEGSISLKVINKNNKKLWNIYANGQPVNWHIKNNPSPPVIIDPRQTIRIIVETSFPSSSNSKT
ncbi:MAG: archaellin/type IV pilin N-terminal domain-containing protein, partial [Candidatus Nanohaloarchaea archaeon]